MVWLPSTLKRLPGPSKLQITFFIYFLAKRLGQGWSQALSDPFADLRFHAGVLHFSRTGRKEERLGRPKFLRKASSEKSGPVAEFVPGVSLPAWRCPEPATFVRPLLVAPSRPTPRPPKAPLSHCGPERKTKWDTEIALFSRGYSIPVPLSHLSHY